jgi:hypothetical protein
MEISVHDNELLSYSVFSDKREIRFHTVFMDKLIDVIFSEVVIYHFEGDNFKTIIFDIYEVELEEIYNDYEDLFLKLKNYNWINRNFETKDDLLEVMKLEKIKAYNFHSSFGLSGWIWAKNMERIKINT